MQCTNCKKGTIVDGICTHCGLRADALSPDPDRRGDLGPFAGIDSRTDPASTGPVKNASGRLEEAPLSKSEQVIDGPKTLESTWRPTEAAGRAGIPDRHDSPPVQGEHKSNAEIMAKFIRDEYRKNTSIILIIGLSGSGKTFYINRLRRNLPQLGWESNPGPAKEITRTPSGIEVTWLQRSGILGIDRYLLLDCAGELFEAALGNAGILGSQRRLRDENLEVAIPPDYLAAISCARAYLLAVRASDVTLGGYSPGGTAFDEVVWDLNKAIVATIAVTNARRSDRLNPGSNSDWMKDGIKASEIEKFEELPRLKMKKPFALVLTCADEVIESNGQADEDPFMIFLTHYNQLHNAIRKSFLYYRCDYITAFNRQRGITPDYSSEHYGAMETFDWIYRILARTVGPMTWLVNLRNERNWSVRILYFPLRILQASVRAVRFLHGPRSTRWGITLRGLLDRGFRSHLKKTPIGA